MSVGSPKTNFHWLQFHYQGSILQITSWIIGLEFEKSALRVLEVLVLNFQDGRSATSQKGRRLKCRWSLSYDWVTYLIGSTRTKEFEESKIERSVMELQLGNYLKRNGRGVHNPGLL